MLFRIALKHFIFLLAFSSILSGSCLNLVFDADACFYLGHVNLVEH